ncbi:MAG: DUF1624 domain-containing protein [Clostridiales bacterium]|nr:DUF1624 domain-containing protein [Clostridiales bacterium]
MGKKDKKIRVKKERAWELDAARGISILLVVWDHFMYDVGFVFRSNLLYSGNAHLVQFSNFGREYFTSDLRLYGWAVFVFLFFYISGICTTFSRSNPFRALKMGIVAGLLSLVTYLADPMLASQGVNIFIKFGVIHCFALSLTIFSIVEFLVNIFNPETPLKKKIKTTLAAYYPEDQVNKTPEYKEEFKEKLDKLKEETGFRKKELIFRFSKFGVFFAITVVAFIMNDLYNVPFYDFSVHYATVLPTTEWTGMFIYTRDWWTADYFPLLPYFGFFMLGASAGVLFYPKKKSLMPALDGKWHKIVSVPGRYTIWIYFISQVVIFGILSLI